jgi:hypothetical protein
MLDVDLYCSKHGLWSDSFHKEYLMVLPYLKGSSLYSCVVYGVNVLVFLKFKGLFLKFKGLFFFFISRFTTSGIRALSWAKKGRFFFFFLHIFQGKKEDDNIQINF